MSNSTPLNLEIKINIESATKEAIQVKAVRPEVVEIHRGWTIVALVSSSKGFILFLVSYIIAKKAPFTSWWNWDAGRVNIFLSIIVSARRI